MALLIVSKQDLLLETIAKQKELTMMKDFLTNYTKYIHQKIASTANAHNLEIHQMDVTTVLNGSFDFDILCHNQKDLLIRTDHSMFVIIMKKSIYGLKQ